MSTTPGTFPDVEDVACDLLAGFGTVGKVTPTNLQGQLPFIRVGVIGGNDDRFTDTSTLDVEVFASDPNAIAEQIRQFLLNGPHVVGNVIFDQIRTVSRPRILPWPTLDVLRSFATYRVACRRTR